MKKMPNLPSRPPEPQSLEEAKEVIKILWEGLTASMKHGQVLEKRVEKLEEQVRTNSKNSSKPPSSDFFMDKTQPEKGKSAKDILDDLNLGRKPRKPGAQKGHKGHGRKLLSEDKVTRFVEHLPEPVCPVCGEPLRISKIPKRRFQIMDLPPVKFEIEEHQIYEGTCGNCKHRATAEYPRHLSRTRLGPRLQALICTLTGQFHLSKKAVHDLLQSVFGSSPSVGTISNTEAHISDLLEEPTAGIREMILRQSVIHADETGHKNSGKLSWLWVMASETCGAFFQVLKGRGSRQAEEFLGPIADQKFVTDRYGGYKMIPPGQRQFCWAHLIRDYQKVMERDGDAGEIGLSLLGATAKMFGVIHRYRVGEIDFDGHRVNIEPIREEFRAILDRGMCCGEKKTQKFCSKLLGQWCSLWLFLDDADVAPTNNRAERSIRPAVLWRKTSYGTRSDRGDAFVARITTIVETAKVHKQSVLEYLTALIKCSVQGLSLPLPMPTN